MRGNTRWARGLALAASVAAGALLAPTAFAGEVQTVILDGQMVTLPNQGDLPKVYLMENLAVNCAPGTIRVADKVLGNNQRELIVTATAPEVILAVSIKSGENNVNTPVFSADNRTATITTSQDISNYVVVFCQLQPPGDTSPPICILSGGGFNVSGEKYIVVVVQDPQSGIQSIVIDEATNATISISPNPYVGTNSAVAITATKTDQTQGSFVKVTVTNTAGLSTTCDPPVPAVKPRKWTPLKSTARPV